MKMIGKFKTDTVDLSMEFMLNNQLVHWKGDPMVEEKTVSSQELHKMVGNSDQTYLCRFEVICDKCKEKEIQSDNELSLEIRELIYKFCDVFEEPTHLPPTRPMDHHIHVNPLEKPINVRP